MLLRIPQCGQAEAGRLFSLAPANRAGLLARGVDVVVYCVDVRCDCDRLDPRHAPAGASHAMLALLTTRCLCLHLLTADDVEVEKWWAFLSPI